MDTFLDYQTKKFSVIGVNGKIQGELRLSGLVRFASFLDGNFIMEDEGKLVIDREGHVTGTIDCHELEVYGRIDGTINSKSRVIIYPGAQVTGNIECDSLSIFPGAIVNIEGNTAQTLS